MNRWKRAITTVGGRPALLAIGAIYVVGAILLFNAELAGGSTVPSALFISFFAGGPGAILLVGGYLLPRSSINTNVYPTITAWVLGAIVVLAAFITFYSFLPSVPVSDPVRIIFIISGFVLVPAFGGGINAARAESRALELEHRNQELQDSHAELQEREAELQSVQDRMEFALIHTDAVVWEWDVENDRASYYPSEEPLFGTTIEDSDDFAAVVHPDDRETAQRSIEQSIDTGEPKHEEIRIVRDGEVRWIEAPGQPVTDDDGSTLMIGVARDITDRKSFERRLQESNARLEEFAHVASHDLQEPLRMITSYLDILDEQYRDDLDDDAREYIDYASDGAIRMREMVQGLLAYSRLDSDAEPLEPTDAETVVENVLDNLQVQIQESDAEIDVGELPTVEADENQLEQVFQNLVSNAIKYRGDAPPKIGISATRQNGMCRFTVADNGIGIDPAYADQIFEVFKRLHNTGEYPGTGIGLALCKRIVNRHGGDIWVDSDPGEGSTFSFTIPLDEQAAG